MLATFLNFILYLWVSVYYWNSRKKIDIYFLLISAYAFIAGCCFLYLQSEPTEYKHLSFLRFIYLWMIVLISLHPFRGIKTIKLRQKDDETFIVKLFIVLFIGAGITAAFLSWEKAFLIYVLGEWGELRQEVYADSGAIELYSSLTEKLAKNIYSYLSPVGIVWGFYQLTKEKFSNLLTITVFIIWFVNSMISAMLIASRGMLLTTAFEFIILFVCFQAQIPTSRKKVLWTLTGVAASFMLTYILAVTVSRFGDDEAGNSIFMYLGHSMLAFNDGIMNSMHHFAWGKYAFSWFVDLFGGNSTIDLTKMGATHGTAFFTFVGTYYVDWGPFITPVAAILISLLLSKFTKKNVYRFSDMMIIAFFATWFLRGVFVYGSGIATIWMMLFLVYFIIRRFEPR